MILRLILRHLQITEGTAVTGLELSHLVYFRLNAFQYHSKISKRGKLTKFLARGQFHMCTGLTFNP